MLSLAKDKLEYLYSNVLTIEKLIEYYPYTPASKKTIVKAIQDNPEDIFGMTFPETRRLWFPINASMRLLLRQQTQDKSISEAKYLVISKNPVDFMMCSTGHGFHSCYALDSNSSNAWSLPSLLCDKNRFLIYLTNAEFKNFNLDDEGDLKFRYLKIKSRCWALLTAKDELFLNKVYSESSIDLKPLLDALKIPSTIYTDSVSKYPITIPRGYYYKNKYVNNLKFRAPIFPILDNGVKLVHYKRKVYYGFGAVNKRLYKTERLSGSKALLSVISTREKCSHCSKTYKSELLESTEDGKFCKACVDKFVKICSTCGKKYFSSPHDDRGEEMCHHCGIKVQIDLVKELPEGSVVRAKLKQRGIWGDERLRDFEPTTATFSLEDQIGATSFSTCMRDHSYTMYVPSTSDITPTETSETRLFESPYPYVRDHHLYIDDTHSKILIWEYKYVSTANEVLVHVCRNSECTRIFSDAELTSTNVCDRFATAVS